MLIEDDKFLCRAYNDGLDRAGYEVVIAYDGGEAVKKIRDEKPDLIILDLILPIKNGFDILEEIKQDDDLKKIPVVILSNHGQDADIQRGKELGALDYLVKANFSMKEVVDRLQDVFARSAKKG
ncbi:MAG: response regulator [bacterium]|nr:response regulator [bacterium]